MRPLLATLIMLAALTAAHPSDSAPVRNTDLPTRGPDAPLTTPLPVRLRRPAVTPDARQLESGSNMARAAALGAQLPPPPIAAGAPAPIAGRTVTVTGSPARSEGTTENPFRMLYAPAGNDNAVFRAQLAALTGGTVDYFDANTSVPSAAQLASYTCVYTWPDAPYVNAAVMGDRLADYVDAGGKVILGSFCTFTTGSALAGRIMTAGYCPVTSPAGTNHLSLSAYAGDGTSSIHAGVLAYGSSYRDFLVLRPGAQADGHYQDGEIATASRADGRVIYVNGGASNGTGDWLHMIANAWTGIPSAPSILYASWSPDSPDDRAAISVLTGGPVNYCNASAVTGPPSAALLATYDCVHAFNASPDPDPGVLGNRLADFVDNGGRVIFGVSSLDLDGRIMTPDYCPVRPGTGPQHNSSSAWMGDGTSCLHSGVTSYAALFRDRLVVQGAGIVDGHFDDGEIALAYRPDGRVVYCNGAAGVVYGSAAGDWRRIVANAATCNLATGPRVLYAVSDMDDPDARALLSSYTGGPVDYFNAHTGTPTAAQLQQYAAVYTWCNYSYADPVLFGNRLANYVDGGGRVVLGPYCTYTSNNALRGAIMGPAYAPVTSVTGSIVATAASYAGDGATRFLHGVSSFNAVVRDSLSLQGAGIADAHYADGQIAIAYRPDRRVVYLNGGFQTGAGDWPMLHTNAFEAPVPYGVLYGTTSDGKLLTFDLVSGAGTQVGLLPYPSANELEIDGTTGQSFYQLAGTNAAQQIFFRTGTGFGPPVPNDAAYTGFEHALGRLYATGNTDPCDDSELRILNPWSGTSTTIGPTLLGTVVGLAFEPRTSTMFGIGAYACVGSVDLLRIDLTDGEAHSIGPPGIPLGSIEFGPDGDLYGGGIDLNAGALFRIHPTTGFMKPVGPSGFGAITGLALAPPAIAGADPPKRGALRLAAAPNPGRGGVVRITFALPRSGDATLELFDVTGRSVWRQARPGLPAGEHAIVWNGQGADGRRLAPGVYLARLVTPAGSRTARIVQLD